MLAEKDDRFRKVVQSAREQGWEISQTGKRHWRFFKRGKGPVFFAGSPSHQGALKHLLTGLKRRGWVPPECFV